MRSEGAVGIARRLTTEQLEERAYRAAEIYEPLKALAETDGWRLLGEVFERQKQAYYEGLAGSLMKGTDKSPPVIDQRKLDYNRGGFDKVAELLAAPENAEKVLSDAIKRLKDRVIEDETDEGVISS